MVAGTCRLAAFAWCFLLAASRLARPSHPHILQLHGSFDVVTRSVPLASSVSATFVTVAHVRHSTSVAPPAVSR
jgi:hypothetical protein